MKLILGRSTLRWVNVGGKLLISLDSNLTNRVEMKIRDMTQISVWSSIRDSLMDSYRFSVEDVSSFGAGR